MSGLYSEILDRLDKAKKNIIMEEWLNRDVNFLF